MVEKSCDNCQFRDRSCAKLPCVSCDASTEDWRPREDEDDGQTSSERFQELCDEKFRGGI